jgi:predicted RNase H-like HicB family nuclease
MTTEYCENGVEFAFSEPEWNPHSYRCHVAVIREDDGSFSTIVLNLPGAGSCGESEEIAFVNVREAIAEVAASYEDAGEEIPWATNYAIPEGVKTKWILVNAKPS